jgi:hypothetical protein
MERCLTAVPAVQGADAPPEIKVAKQPLFTGAFHVHRHP